MAFYHEGSAMTSHKIYAIVTFSVTMLFVVAIITVTSVYSSVGCVDNTVTVKTRSGYMRGVTTEVRVSDASGKRDTSEEGEMRTVHEFHNVPYADKPVRFAKPVMKSEDNPWKYPIDVTKDKGIKCIQADTDEGTEDCLVLSVRSPDVSASLPVVVWIHGGGLQNGDCCGEGYSFDSELTAEMGMVTVNINYRLGFLGWGVLEPESANNGLRDMVAALTWIQENAAAFGGDPSQVTIIGESGGGTAVLALLSSPLANNLFRRAISLSPAPEFRNSATDGWAAQDDAMHVKVGLGCNQDDLVGLKKCLMSRPAKEFSHMKTMFGGSAHGKLTAIGANYFDFPYAYGESQEAPLLVMTDQDTLIGPANLPTVSFTPDNKVEILLSNLAQETAINAYFGSNLFPTQESLESRLSELLPHLPGGSPPALEDVLALYTSPVPQLKWENMVTDMRGTCPSNVLADVMATSAHHDVYRLLITASLTSFPGFAWHAMDTAALFGYTSPDLGELKPSTQDLQLMRNIRAMVAGFVRGDGPGWSKYPASSALLEDGGVREVSEKPRATACAGLAALDLVKYGWQNK